MSIGGPKGGGMIANVYLGVGVRDKGNFQRNVYVVKVGLQDPWGWAKMAFCS